ncbi:uncharacterized protein DUF2778 [Marinobacterium halophilum]|uniref:Uncharacterized protein DUF2778 n=1 Tax=Marinobacterium halophilum TaxID=267374 RepID=A0A2P8EZE1_9GAMM|nr:DUF2778 domain-containing protein [Marinobacterium halophilum]PSL14827.1 uncharacterized protein DUF2778 [Marinobacterium halophilum]
MIDYSFHLNNKSMSSFKMGGASFPAFSGMNQHMNRAKSHCISNEGPIPKGTYYIIDRQSGGFLGPLRDWLSDKDEWFALYAIDSNIDDETLCDQVKRGQFRLHPKVPLGISKGCITIDSWSDFQVIRSLLKSANTQKIPNTDI